ncbi:SAM-dependent methyltransferase [Actinophytocola sp.]|uniref:SAM-dependent methyltransferase n=1 Tax=Actinophytocola sp. TaxID=1872138 RepID=UPI002ED260B5
MSDFSPEWLALREPADAESRADELLTTLRTSLTSSDLVVRDLGSGTGSMARWLSPRLPGTQKWVLTDQDPVLLKVAAASVPGAVPDLRDITTITAEDLAGTSLVTGSALLDILTSTEVTALATACVKARCPALFALSVVGRVELTPADPLDERMAAAFNAHQSRTVGGRALLGPSAVAATATAFIRLGATVHRRPSPWRLGPDRAQLTAEWLRGWVSAACEQEPDLRPFADDYLRRRLDGDLRVIVHHEDLLALPA